MSATLLILTPLLVLGVVLLLGFAGCEFDPGVQPVTRSLVFRATVPAAFTVLAVDGNHPPGVQFIWMRPGGQTGSQVVTAFTAGMDGVTHVKVYEFYIPTPEDGVWIGLCNMAVREGSASALGSSMSHFFTPDFAATPYTAVSFRGEGSPLAHEFAVVYAGIGAA